MRTAFRAIFDDVLITTTDVDWTVMEFLEAFPAMRYPLRHDRQEEFENDLYDAIGLTLRDRYFVRRALAEGLDDDPALRHELALLDGQVGLSRAARRAGRKRRASGGGRSAVARALRRGHQSCCAGYA